MPSYLQPVKSADEIRREEYAVARASGMSPRQAALNAGYTESQAGNAPRDIEPKARQTIRELLPIIGASNEVLAKRLAEGLDAVRAHITKDGDVVHSTDFKERREYVRLISELTGELKQGVGASSISVTLSGPLAEAFMQRMQGQVIDGE